MQALSYIAKNLAITYYRVIAYILSISVLSRAIKKCRKGGADNTSLIHRKISICLIYF